MPAPETSSVEVLAAEPRLLSTLGATVGPGTWFTRATAAYPTVVLGAGGTGQPPGADDRSQWLTRCQVLVRQFGVPIDHRRG